MRSHYSRSSFVALFLPSIVVALLLCPEGVFPVSAQQEDCCTLESTARIADAAGFVEIAGVKLGTSAKQVVEILQKRQPALSIQPPAIIHVDPLVGVDFVTGFDAGTLDSGGPRNATLLEEIQVALTQPPSDPAVWGISYQVRYLPQTRPTYANTLAELRKRYGPESGTTDVGGVAEQIFGVETLDAYWVFDASGKLLAEQDAAQFYRFCAEYSSGVKVTLSDTSFLKGRGEWVEPRGRINCGNNTLVTARWDPSEPSMGEPKGFVKNLKIEGANGLLHRSAYEATYAMELQAGRGSR